MSENPRAIWGAKVMPVEVMPGVERRTLGCTEQAMLVEWRFEAGRALPLHDHPHDQVGYLIQGEMEMEIGGEVSVFHAGDSWAIPGGVPHRASFPVASVVIDCFTPPREDYR